MTRVIPMAVLLCCGAWAQPAADEPAFEVASVKPSPPPSRPMLFNPRKDGGPGTGDPIRIDFRDYSLTALVVDAYKLNYWGVSAPDWMMMEHYDIAAKVPPGATKEQFRLMLQRLLAERFKLQVHRETKEMPLYSLTVARNGPKLKPHVQVAQPGGRPGQDGAARIRLGADGYPVLPPETTMAMTKDRFRYQKNDADLAWLAEMLSDRLEAPVRDDTGLRGRYDIGLYWSARPLSVQPEADAGPDLIAAVQEQLGLKLEKKKGPVEILVIDHAEKVPTGN
jgi:uncharacterized protein (TIGR03435 family)